MKIGRPKVNNLKNIRLYVRIDKKTNEDILKYCADNGIRKTSDFIRRAIKEKLNII